ncbi:CDP-glycerol glycerophosphotransferase family protein [Butyrivibrio sp. TB]|uniref:CDP-glycerol glycerophosphotransferase family protein n=1 Tax=Butyrivibrio sp. TB TaxID=1520809 RepID=UPI0008B589F3|nr:CDP-glycerol glycerophosphotransferase family protein [Butyrivibrio sp. TB]SEQ14959.1 CDP-Glycerol:Poly(glycerophosphate) glycerophosphotransferase [Butyrivibrio sp. TB]
MIKNYVIYGAGRLGRSFNIEEHSECYQMCAYCDASPEKVGTQINGYPVIAKNGLKDYCAANNIDMIVIALGDSGVKAKVAAELRAMLGEEIHLQDYTDLYYSKHEDWNCLKKTLMKNEVPEYIDAAFFSTVFAYFVEAGIPLVEKYREKGKSFLLVFPYLDDGEWSFAGHNNLGRLRKMIDAYEEKGIRCISLSNPGLEGCKIKICYNLGYWLYYIPYNWDFGSSRKNIAIQITPFLAHQYIKYDDEEVEQFETVFREDLRNKVDYFIGSEYFCDWIVGHDKTWGNKMLRLGYPRMDRLYKTMNTQPEIPKEWLDAIEGKTVIFSALYNIEPYLALFPKDNSDTILIWRPHPLSLRHKEYVEKIRKYEENYSVIVDFQPGYYAASSVSDALISDIEVSLNLNYLYYQKPILLIIKEVQYGDYEDQAWYKAMYKARNTDEVISFISMIEAGKDYEKEQLQPYRDYMTSLFDGQVCERIYDFVENRL